jgi:putative transposase
MSEDQTVLFGPEAAVAPQPPSTPRSAAASSARAGPASVQFVTIRLADALRPSDFLRMKLEALRAAEGRTEAAARNLRRLVEAHLDAGAGGRALETAECARLVEDAFLATHGARCTLRAWVVMPNHAHVLCTIGEREPLKRLVGTWKAASARRLNARLAREGGVWARDFFERRLNDRDEEERAARYVESNPMLAGWCADPRTWAASSLRFRRPDGALDDAALDDAARGARTREKAPVPRDAR